MRSRANLTRYISPSHSEIRPSDVGLTTIWAVLAEGATWTCLKLVYSSGGVRFWGGIGCPAMIEVLPSTCYPYRPRPVRQGLQAVAVHGGTQGFAKGNDVVLSSGAEMVDRKAKSSKAYM